MKLFGWGKSKDPQPQGRQQVSTPDPRSGSHGLDRCTSLQSGMGSIMPGNGSNTSMRRQCQGLFDTTSKAAPSVVNPEADLEEKLQDKIRFVFSHEREGLLAIGTFALEQLQSIRNTIDGHPRGGNAAANSAANADPAAGDHEYGFGSEGVNLLALDNDVMQSSDDEDQLQRSWLAARQTCDLPVFGDTSADAVESDAEQAPLLRPATHAVQQPWHDDSKALTLYRGKPDAAESTTPIFTLAPELRSALQQPFLPHWTDSVPPPVLANVEQTGPFVDDDYYATRLCGLFNKRTKSLKSKRMAIVPAAGEDYAKRIIPIEKAAHHDVTKRSSSSLLKFNGSMPSLGKLAKLWWANCTPSSTARIAPERKPSPQPAFKVALFWDSRYLGTRGFFLDKLSVIDLDTVIQVAPCGSKGAGARGRVQAHERMMHNHEHWIKDDEDCEFATFLFNMSR